MWIKWVGSPAYIWLTQAYNNIDYNDQMIRHYINKATYKSLCPIYLCILSLVPLWQTLYNIYPYSLIFAKAKLIPNSKSFFCRIFSFLFFLSLKGNSEVLKGSFIRIQPYTIPQRDPDCIGRLIYNHLPSTPKTRFSECDCQTPFVH